MKKINYLLFLIFGFEALAHELKGPPHLDLEMTSEQYHQHLAGQRGHKFFKNDNPTITQAINLGNRLSSWIKLVNEQRTPENAIRLTSSANRGGGIPIDRPNSYSPETIREKLQLALNEMPQEMKTILTTGVKLPSTLPVDDQTFITFARQIDRQYQTAARYKSIDQWRSYYIQAANRDVRGFYYLSTNKISADDLRDVELIPENKRDAVKEALTGICFNSTSRLEDCQKAVAGSWRENTLAEFYKKFIKDAKKNWDSFFLIPKNARRKDINWRGNTAEVPFNTPSIPKFVPYLQENIEDEFRFGDWIMRINFGVFQNGPELVFKPNVVPHVNGLGGNQIVMDSNQPIEEYESQWTIRHEFGHVLGLPDCYHEFYDTNTNAYVNYQIDVTDLMCSRAGNMNERIYLELKQAYGN